MNSLLRTLSAIVVAAAFSQASGHAAAEVAAYPAVASQPLNLSLPRSDLPAVTWDSPESSRIRREEGIRIGAGSERIDTEVHPGRQGTTIRPGGMPYGSGFEARQRSSNGGRGMGRGR